jgi:glyoxylase-like metal-dependent hydrolase (beta-lactamase superfamily II)
VSKAFASQADLVEKKITFEQLSENAYAYTAEGDPNTGIVIGDDAVLVADAQATPVMAQDVIRRIREVTDKPTRYVLLTHYHAVRVLGASAYKADHIIASQDTRDLIVERGEADMKSEIERGDWVIFDHCLPFDVTRAYDEATKYPDPRIWTAQRDKDMWQSLEG